MPIKILNSLFFQKEGPELEKEEVPTTVLFH